jgi:hypothetical protein
MLKPAIDNSHSPGAENDLVAPPFSFSELRFLVHSASSIA